MRYRIVLDTSSSPTHLQPERVQQYLSMTLNGLELWANPRLRDYPGSVVRVFESVETLVMTLPTAIIPLTPAA